VVHEPDVRPGRALIRRAVELDPLDEAARAVPHPHDADPDLPHTPRLRARVNEPPPSHERAPYTQRGETCKSRVAREFVLLLAEAGGGAGREVPLGVDQPRLREQLLLAFGVVRVRHAAVHRAHRGALLLVEETDAFGALLG